MKNVTENPASTKQKQIVYALALSSLFVLAASDLAYAGPIEDGVDWLLELLTNGIARSVAIIGIVILGYLAWAGRITGEQCAKYILGIVLVFGGATIVDLIIAAVS
ncbi:MAG: TrbC/VirB2 family protein [Geobacteraceae bacterium]|nr:TrbC/VirB2 family protein [Geobacteraceae bacterium]